MRDGASEIKLLYLSNYCYFIGLHPLVTNAFSSQWEGMATSCRGSSGEANYGGEQHVCQGPWLAEICW